MNISIQKMTIFHKKTQIVKKSMFSYNPNMNVKHAFLEVFRTNFPQIEPRQRLDICSLQGV